MATSIRCPGCGASLEPSGTLSTPAGPRTVYQCDRCTRPWEFGGQTFQAALTFALDADGNCFDPETLEPMQSPPRPGEN